jgi:hypothetical protein
LRRELSSSSINASTTFPIMICMHGDVHAIFKAMDVCRTWFAWVYFRENKVKSVSETNQSLISEGQTQILDHIQFLKRYNILHFKWQKNKLNKIYNFAILFHNMNKIFNLCFICVCKSCVCVWCALWCCFRTIVSLHHCALSFSLLYQMPQSLYQTQLLISSAFFHRQFAALLHSDSDKLSSRFAQISLRSFLDVLFWRGMVALWRWSVWYTHICMRSRVFSVGEGLCSISFRGRRLIRRSLFWIFHFFNCERKMFAQLLTALELFIQEAGWLLSHVLWISSCDWGDVVTARNASSADSWILDKMFVHYTFLAECGPILSYCQYKYLSLLFYRSETVLGLHPVLVQDFI